MDKREIQRAASNLIDKLIQFKRMTRMDEIVDLSESSPLAAATSMSVWLGLLGSSRRRAAAL